MTRPKLKRPINWKVRFLGPVKTSHPLFADCFLALPVEPVASGLASQGRQTDAVYPTAAHFVKP
jgi:hypothetical protein